MDGGQGAPGRAAALALVAAGVALCRAAEWLLEARRRRLEEQERQMRVKEQRRRKKQKRRQAASAQAAASASGSEDTSSDAGSQPEGHPEPEPEAPRTFVRVTDAAKLDLVALTDRVRSPAAGAVVTFSGTTRNSFEGKTVLSLEYEAYTTMAEKELRRVCDQVREKWADIIHLAIEHKIGSCPIGDTSVIIAVSSPHRASALEAAKFALDTLKANVPIWKKEVYLESDPAWKANKEFFEAHNVK